MRLNQRDRFRISVQKNSTLVEYLKLCSVKKETPKDEEINLISQCEEYTTLVNLAKKYEDIYVDEVQSKANYFIKANQLKFTVKDANNDNVQLSGIITDFFKELHK